MKDLLYYFGSVGDSVMTLFQSTTAGLDWRVAYELLESGGIFLSGVFLATWAVSTTARARALFLPRSRGLHQHLHDFGVEHRAPAD